MLSVVMLSVSSHNRLICDPQHDNIVYYYAEWHDVEYRYVECHYAECRGAKSDNEQKVLYQ